MLPEDKKRQILETVKKMEQDGVPSDTIQRIVDNFKTKYDVPETQVASKSPFLAQPSQPVQKTAQDFGRQPIDVSRKETETMDYLKSIGKGLGAGALQLGASTAGLISKVLPDTKSYTGKDFLQGTEKVLGGAAEKLRQSNLQEAVRTRDPRLYGASNVGELVGGEAINPLNYLTAGGAGLGKRLGGGVMAGVAGQLSYNPELDQMGRGQKFITDVAFGTALPATIDTLVSKASPLAKGRVESAIGKMFPEQIVPQKVAKIEQKLDKKIANTATDIFGLSGKKKQGTATGIVQQNKDYADVFKEMAKSADELNITDELGNTLDKVIPENRMEFATQLKDFKNKIYNAYSDIAPDTKVNLAQIADELESKLASSEVKGRLITNKTFSNTLRNQIEGLRNAGEVSVKEAQGALEGLNEILAPVWRGGQITESKDALLLVAGKLRNLLDNTLEMEGGDLYRPMKQLYGKAKNIEDQVFKSARKTQGAIDKGLDDLFDGVISAGVFSLNPALVLKGLGAKGAKKFLAGFRNPDRKLNKLFTEVYNKNLGESILSKARRQATEVQASQAQKLAQKQMLDEQARLSNIPRALEAERLKSEGKILGDNFIANQPTTNYSLQRGQGVQLRPDEGVLPKQDFRLERSSSYNFPETKTNKIVRNPNLLNPETKGTDYNKLASEMKMPVTPTQARVQKVKEEIKTSKVEKKPNPTISQGSKETVEQTASRIKANGGTFEEFVKAQPTGYHFTSPETKITKWSTKKSQGRIWFTDNPNAGENVGASGKGKMYTVRFDKNAKWATPEQAEKSFTDQLISEGYDGVFHPDSNGEYGNYYEVFNPKVIKTKSQLENIWKQANEKTPTQARVKAITEKKPTKEASNSLLEEAKKYPNDITLEIKKNNNTNIDSLIDFESNDDSIPSFGNDNDNRIIKIGDLEVGKLQIDEVNGRYPIIDLIKIKDKYRRLGIAGTVLKKLSKTYPVIEADITSKASMKLFEKVYGKPVYIKNGKNGTRISYKKALEDLPDISEILDGGGIDSNDLVYATFDKK